MSLAAWIATCIAVAAGVTSWLLSLRWVSRNGDDRSPP